MESKNLDDTQSWRKRHDSLGAIARTEQRLEEVENFLYSSVSRLARGVHGLSGPLDRELDRLRAAVKRRSDPEEISELALRVQECGRDVPAARALLRLVDALELPKTQRRHVRVVRRVLTQVADERELEEVHTKLASILNESLEERSPSHRGADARTQDTQLFEECEGALLQLLEQLPLSEPLRAKAETLRGQLGSMNAVVAIGGIAAITSACRAEIERERDEVQRYLEDLD